jgi:ligand-binding sensor domain-containing protein
MHHPLIVLGVLLALLIAPAHALYVDVPDYDTGIVSAGVKDVVNGLHGDVVFATDSGISVYTMNGTWYSVTQKYPRTTSYGALKPISNMVTAVEFDAEGDLWIGYANGLQFQNGTGYETVQDQQLLKNLGITAMTQWGDEMWIATGHAGLHRYRNGAWTWCKPFGPENLGCYTISSMVVDAASDSLIIGSEHNGIWMLANRTVSLHFEPVLYQNRPIYLMSDLTVDPFGGVYIFNETSIYRYTQDQGVDPVLGVRDLGDYPNSIRDVAAAPSGMLLIATDRGIYCWQGSGVLVHVTAQDGLRSNIVKRLFVDAAGRCWFIVPGNVGYMPVPEEIVTIDVHAAPIPASTATEPVYTGEEQQVSPPERSASDGEYRLFGIPGEVARALVETGGSLQEWINAISIQLTGGPIFPEVLRWSEESVSEDPGQDQGSGETANDGWGFLDPGMPVGWGYTLRDLQELIGGSREDIGSVDRSGSAGSP